MLQSFSSGPPTRSPPPDPAGSFHPQTIFHNVPVLDTELRHWIRCCRPGHPTRRRNMYCFISSQKL